jgi:hypothetical protein
MFVKFLFIKLGKKRLHFLKGLEVMIAEKFVASLTIPVKHSDNKTVASVTVNSNLFVFVANKFRGVFIPTKVVASSVEDLNLVKAEVHI